MIKSWKYFCFPSPSHVKRYDGSGPKMGRGRKRGKEGRGKGIMAANHFRFHFKPWIVTGTSMKIYICLLEKYSWYFDAILADRWRRNPFKRCQTELLLQRLLRRLLRRLLGKETGGGERERGGGRGRRGDMFSFQVPQRIQDEIFLLVWADLTLSLPPQRRLSTPPRRPRTPPDTLHPPTHPSDRTSSSILRQNRALSSSDSSARLSPQQQN